MVLSASMQHAVLCPTVLYDSFSLATQLLEEHLLGEKQM